MVKEQAFLGEMFMQVAKVHHQARLPLVGGAALRDSATPGGEGDGFNS